MSNYPDNVDPADPRAPWNQVEPTCTRCKDELDPDAQQQEHVGDGADGFPIDVPGWPGGLCTNCADADYDKHGCTCDEAFPCSLACVGATERHERAVQRGIL